MQDAAEQAVSIPQLAASHKVGIGATGAAVTPQEAYQALPAYGEFLVNHGALAISYAEWIKIVSAVYVVVLLARMTYSGIKKIISMFDKDSK